MSGIVSSCLPTLRVVLTLGVLLPGGGALQCVTIDACMCQFDDYSGTADLTSTGNTDGTAKYMDYTARDDGFLYSYNPCHSFSQNLCTDAAMCQSDHSQQSWKTGDQSTATWSYDGTNIQIYYYAETDVMRETFITAICDPSYNEPFVEIQGEPSEGVAQYIWGPLRHRKYRKSPSPYDVCSAKMASETGPGGTRFRCHRCATTFYGRITTKCACPDGCHTTTHFEISMSLSGGWILIIIVMSVGFVYLVGGVLFMRFARHASGREMVPNSSFWGAIPGLIKDGFVFVIGCIRGGGKSRSTYQNL